MDRVLFKYMLFIQCGNPKTEKHHDGMLNHSQQIDLFIKFWDITNREVLEDVRTLSIVINLGK